MYRNRTHCFQHKPCCDSADPVIPSLHLNILTDVTSSCLSLVQCEHKGKQWLICSNSWFQGTNACCISQVVWMTRHMLLAEDICHWDVYLKSFSCWEINVRPVRCYPEDFAWWTVIETSVCWKCLHSTSHSVHLRMKNIWRNSHWMQPEASMNTCCFCLQFLVHLIVISQSVLFALAHQFSSIWQ